MTLFLFLTKLLVFLSICLFIYTENIVAKSMSDTEKVLLKEKVLEMFDHAYGAYKKYAHPADELMPLSCRGRYRGSEADRGDIDEALGNFSLTLIDTLDTLVVLGYVEEFEEQVKYVIDHVTFNSDAVVSVFETNIRVLGGLLGAHSMAVTLKKNGKSMQWYNDELLGKATDIADRLLPAFNTSTGIPYPKVNLRYGIHHSKSRAGHESHTCTACAGTMIMEFGALSRLTGKPIYEEKAHKAMEALWRYRSRHSDLVGTTINIHNGDWTRRDSGVGAGIDSYYEYCLKAYILLGDEEYRDKFNKHYAAIKKYIHQGYMLLDVFMHQPDRPARGFVDALQAFWPGLQVLKGDLKPAIETHEMLYNVAKKFKFLPEAFTTNFDLHWAQHPLRPEFIESTYFLYQATKDPYYLTVGKHVLHTLEGYAKVKCGFAAFKDLRTLTHEDKMDSFVLAETFKYLYLLFSEESEHVINIHDFVFTTEAHLLPLYLSVTPTSRPRSNVTKEKEAPQTLTVELEDDHSKSCPNTRYHKNLRTFAQKIRRNVNAGQKNGLPACNRPQQSTWQRETITEKFMNQVKTNVKGRPRRLLASEFSITNAKHMEILKDFGINVQKEANGKVQLMHQSNQAKSTTDAEEGVLFMQEMIQLAKERGEADGVIKPRSVHLMSHPYNGLMKFYGGYAQFGGDLEKMIVQSEAIETIPYRACQTIQNAVEIAGRIAVVERGDCMFIDKVRLLQRIGAKGVIIIDHQVDTSEKMASPFGMSGDGNEGDVRIPAVFLFHVEGKNLRRLMRDYTKLKGGDNRITVKLSAEPRDPEEEHAVPTATAPPPTNLPSRTDVPIKDEKKREELNLIPDEYFMANQEVYRSSNGNTRSMLSEYVGPNKHGEIRKFIRSKLETCLNPECSEIEVRTFTDDIEFFIDGIEPRKIPRSPKQPEHHYFQQSTRGVIAEFSTEKIDAKSSTNGDKEPSSDSATDSYIDDVVSENLKDSSEKGVLQKKEGDSTGSGNDGENLICTASGCFKNLEELRETTDFTSTFIKEVESLHEKLARETAHDLRITDIMVEKTEALNNQADASNNNNNNAKDGTKKSNEQNLHSKKQQTADQHSSSNSESTSSHTPDDTSMQQHLTEDRNSNNNKDRTRSDL